jgi:hypothetical protein
VGGLWAMYLLRNISPHGSGDGRKIGEKAVHSSIWRRIDAILGGTTFRTSNGDWKIKRLQNIARGSQEGETGRQNCGDVIHFS